jgi:hypothetical protein
MISEDLQRTNATLRDRIEQVVEMHPELRNVIEAIALNQDLHVEAGAPFLERTSEKLKERARVIIQCRPELAHYFDGLVPTKPRRDSTSREAVLSAALAANVDLRVRAERLIAAYVAPGSDRAAIISDLIVLFDGPAHREARTLSAEAIGAGLWERRS